jgi:hypothetical protein
MLRDPAAGRTSVRSSVRAPLAAASVDNAALSLIDGRSSYASLVETALRRARLTVSGVEDALAVLGRGGRAVTTAGACSRARP